ncbi:undecaprenyl-diphosphate phosphatase [Halobacillus sp. HZG1]|uniref:undecaprenyl-diphosphate phosphatase n=1 Tax=Halobacillus sp. HZG1 TaxID=3111769 RepID=UPI002DBFB840|nr:undecaprenyl-diphosphate phosphatase [Halobacillus sp. HZG1]MEC3883536.1 undecaprenyl-diphosphate phosphatase [Halobacillus sp. HZG1]
MEDLFTLFKYALLGALQGFTEPIPISSSGHLVIAQELLRIDVPKNDFGFEVLMNFASLIAVVIIYRDDLIRLSNNGLKFVSKRTDTYKKDFMFILYLLVGTIPAGLLGLLLEDWLSEKLKGIVPVGVALLITGIALWIIRNFKGRKSDKSLNFRDAIIVGFAQAIALIPGISRSGATIVASMGVGMQRDTALRFSFLLYIPVSLGTILLKINDISFQGVVLPYAAAFILSLTFSYFSLKWFMGVMERGNLKYFAYYCFVAGLLILFIF